MLSEIIKNSLQEKNLTLESLQKQTNIPLKHLMALEAGDFLNLPASVFVRGYLKKITKILELDQEDIWLKFQSDSKYSKVAPIDILPQNRFEQPKKNRYIFLKLSKIIPIIIITLFLIGFLSFQIKSLLGNPKLRLESPALDLTTKDQTIEVRGYGPSNSYVKINGKDIYLGKDGYFNEKIDLNPGLNEIIVEAQNKLKRTTTITRRIFKE